jgi:LmbE family N-acetylglucosaminyl deacetylase
MDLTDLPPVKKVVVFSAHPDDDVFGCGGTITDFSKNGCTVICVYLTSGWRGVGGTLPPVEKARVRRVEAEKACKAMGSRPIFMDLDHLKKLEFSEQNAAAVRALLEKEKPDLVITHNHSDSHQTHRTLADIVEHALQKLGPLGPKEVWFYETWSPLHKPDVIHFFKDKTMDNKIKAIRQHKSQTSRLDMESAMRGLSMYRGRMGQEIIGGHGGMSEKKLCGEAFLKKRLGR